MARGAGVVPDEAAAGANPVTGAAISTNLEGNIHVAADLGNSLDRVFRALTIQRFKEREKQPVSDRLIGRDAEKALRRIGPLQFLRGEIKVPGPDAKSLDSEPQMLVMDRVVWRSSNCAGHAQAFSSAYSSLTLPVSTGSLWFRYPTTGDIHKALRHQMPVTDP
jgi:hypothetical protein